MILLNIARNGRYAETDAEVMAAAAKAWVAKDESIEKHDTLLAVYRNVVQGAYRIAGWSRRDSDGRAVFELVPDDELRARWVGNEPPIPFVPGQGNPVRFYDGA